jgi:4-azaleucine resistance transporter AzlC
MSSFTQKSGIKTNWFRSISAAIPVMMGYLPIGFAYGVLAVNGGLTVFQTVLMSIIVYAGSSQLIAAGLFAQAINPFSIIATTFVVNLRHMLMSAALAPHLKHWRSSQVAAFCFELTDESFGIHSLRFERGDTDRKTTLSINFICQISWVTGSFLGAVAGNLIQDVRPFALDYALPAMFIALLILQIRNKTFLVIAIISSILSLALWFLGVTQWNVIIATTLGAAIGAGVETWQTRRSY